MGILTAGGISCSDGRVSTVRSVRLTDALLSVLARSVQKSISSCSMGPHFVMTTRQCTFHTEIRSCVVSQISCATSVKGVDSGLTFRPRQYDAVICLLPRLSVHAAVTHRSSTLCAYAMWMLVFSCNRLADVIVASLKSMMRGSGCSMMIPNEVMGPPKSVQRSYTSRQSCV